MQEYIYGNIGHRTYEYLCSDPDFFKDARRIAAMEPILTYDTNAQHGDLLSGTHQCYSMLTSDLNLADEEERLFIQASGVDPYRSSVYVCGYMSDSEDPDVYGPTLIRLLKTRFMNLDEKIRYNETHGFRQLTVDEIPCREDRERRAMDPQILGSILLALMQGKRAIVRLTGQGAEAMEQSRELLLNVYERLPYDQRRQSGFMTGVSGPQLRDMDTAIPVTMQLLVTDGDTDISHLRSDKYQQIFDLKHPQSIPPMVREKNGKPMSYTALMDYLVREDLEPLNAFFAFCRRTMREDDQDTVPPTIVNYSLLLEFFKEHGRGSGSTEDAGETFGDRFRSWAAVLYSNRIPRKVKTALCERIAGKVSEKQMTEYLLSRTDSFDLLSRLGVLDGEEQTWLTDPQYASGEVQDRNMALSLRLAESLIHFYPQPEQVRQRLTDTLAERFEELAVERCAALRAERLTGEEAEAVRSLELTADGGKSLAAEIRRKACEVIEKSRTEVLEKYRRARKTYTDWGIRQITEWAEKQDYRSAPDLDGLYRSLSQAYLFEELLDGSRGGAWNPELARVITAICTEPAPASLADYERADACIRKYSESFRTYGGVFTPEQEQKLQQAREQSKYAGGLAARVYTDLPRLMELFREIRESGLPGTVQTELKKRVAGNGIGAILPDRILASAAEICECARHYPDERELLFSLITANCSVWRIPADLDRPGIHRMLLDIQRLNRELMITEELWFGPWMIRSTCSAVMKELTALKDYRHGARRPDLSSYGERVWAAENLRSNADLLYLLAVEYRCLGDDIIPVLAQKLDWVKPGDIRDLYLAGWSAGVLRRGAGGQTGEAWKKAVDGLFPSWPELPAPVVREQKAGRPPRWILITEPIVLGLTGAAPAGILAAMSCSSLPAYGGCAGVLLTLALAFTLCSVLLHSRNQKKLLRWNVLAMAADLLLTAVLMLLPAW